MSITLYGPQDFTAGTFTKPTSFQITTHGGADAPITGYPEFAAGEEIKTVNADGPLGERVVDANVAGTYSSGGLAMLGIGDLPSGEWDGTDGVVVEWDQYFSSTALADSFVGQLMVLVARISVLAGPSADPEVGLFSGDSFIWIGFEQDAGANFHYDIYYVVNGSTVHNTSITDVADNAWHRVKIRYKPGTVTGALSGLYFPRSADGYFELLVDGVSMLSATGIQLDIPTKSTYSSTPNLAYGAWHGFAGLMGKFTNFTLAVDTVVPLPIPVPTTNKARTLCVPDTQVGDGGKGSSGCTSGGTGWTPSYASTLGTPATAADPAAGIALKYEAELELWIELVHTTYPGATLTTYRRAMTDLDDDSTYYGGLKQLGLTHVGDIEHALSDHAGNFEGATVNIQLSDYDRFWRTLLGTVGTKRFLRDEMYVYAISRTGRKASLVPRLLARTLIDDYPLVSDMMFHLTGADQLFSEFGSFSPDKKFPLRTVPDGVWTTTPRDTLKRAMPVIYGEVSDIGAVDPVTAAATDPKGLCPLIYVGTEDLAGDSPTAPAWVEDASIDALPYPLTTTNAIFIGGDIKVTTYVWAGAVRDGKIQVLPGSVGPMNPLGVTEPDGVALACHIDQVTDGADYYIMWVSDDATFHPITNPTAGNIGTATHDDATFDGWYGNDFTMVVKSLNNSGIVGGTVWDAYLVCGHAVHSILGLYGSDLGLGDPNADRHRIAIDLATRGGGDVLVPGDAAWPFANTYRDYTGPDGTTYRATMIYVRGPLSDDHKNGVINLAANVIGVESVGDGTGNPILQFFRAYQHFIDNYVHRNYSSGNWPVNAAALPLWGDGVAKTKGSTFVAAQAYSATRLGDAIGYTVGWCATDQESLRDVIQWWNDSGDCRIGISLQGQVIVSFIDTTASTAAWPRFTHVTDLFGNVKIWTPRDELENVVQGEYDWDADKDVWRSGLLSLADADGIEQNKNVRRISKSIGCRMVRDEDHFNDVLARRLARLRFGPTYYEFTVHQQTGGLDVDIGDGILLTTHEGPGATEASNIPLLILRQRFETSTGMVTLVALEI